MRINLQLAIFSFVAALFLYFLKYYEFPWGGVQFLSNGSTFNDFWYYNIDCISTAGFSATLAYMTTSALRMNPGSWLIWFIKYIAISVSLLFCIRALFHLFTNEAVVWLELIVHILTLSYTAYRAFIWKKNHHMNNETTISRSTTVYN